MRQYLYLFVNCPDITILPSPSLSCPTQLYNYHQSSSSPYLCLKHCQDNGGRDLKSAQNTPSRQPLAQPNPGSTMAPPPLQPDNRTSLLAGQDFSKKVKMDLHLPPVTITDTHLPHRSAASPMRSSARSRRWRTGTTRARRRPSGRSRSPERWWCGDWTPGSSYGWPVRRLTR